MWPIAGRRRSARGLEPRTTPTLRASGPGSWGRAGGHGYEFFGRSMPEVLSGGHRLELGSKCINEELRVVKHVPIERLRPSVHEFRPQVVLEFAIVFVRVFLK